MRVDSATFEPNPSLTRWPIPAKYAMFLIYKFTCSPALIASVLMLLGMGIKGTPAGHGITRKSFPGRFLVQGYN